MGCEENFSPLWNFADQQSILYDFDKRGPEINQPPPAPPVLLAVPTAPPAPTIANPSSAGVIASREDVLTRAAALGRGAATTGFKSHAAASLSAAAAASLSAAAEAEAAGGSTAAPPPTICCSFLRRSAAPPQEIFVLCASLQAQSRSQATAAASLETLFEASLSGVEPLMQKIHSEIRRVDAGILTAVRQQARRAMRRGWDAARRGENRRDARLVGDVAPRREAVLLHYERGDNLLMEPDNMGYALGHFSVFSFLGPHFSPLLLKINLFHIFEFRGEAGQKMLGLKGSVCWISKILLLHRVDDNQYRGLGVELIIKACDQGWRFPQMGFFVGEDVGNDASDQYVQSNKSNSGTKAKEDLAAATCAVEELMYKIREIKSKAEQSETMVQEICLSAVEQLQVMASKRQYKEAAAQLEAVNQLCSHFEAYKDIPKITELREKFKNIRQILKSHVFSDFSRVYLDIVGLSYITSNERSNKLRSQISGAYLCLLQLADACLVVDALEPSVREELVKNFCSRELTSYRQIFEGAELAKLDKTERRYAWIKRRLRTNEEIWKIFPPSWHVPYLLCIQFCKLTRTQIVEILDNLKEKPDVGTLLLALQRTLEFEEELADKFGAGTRSKEAGNDFEDTGETNNQAISDIRKKYEKKLAAHQGSFQLIKLAAENYLSALMWQFNFRGIISSCFELHMAVYVELEEKTLMENLEKLVQEETWDIEEGTQTNILSSSMQVFQRVLKAYATKLFTRLPKGGTGIVAAATGMDGQIKTSDRDERLICYIINTAEYCHKTAGELAENVSKIIDPQLVDAVDMSEVQDEFSAVITKALVTLVHGLETKFDAEMAAMTRIPWATLESVGDQSA
ncbi:hypothetical protein C3L33_21818, partial [Rhododendron williamsianum]